MSLKIYLPLVKKNIELPDDIFKAFPIDDHQMENCAGLELVIQHSLHLSIWALLLYWDLGYGFKLTILWVWTALICTTWWNHKKIHWLKRVMVVYVFSNVVYNLTNNIDVEDTKQRMEQYQRENRDLIQKNKAKLVCTDYNYPLIMPSLIMIIWD